MPRKKTEPGLDELIDAAVAAPDPVQRQRLSARARTKVVPKRKIGRPTKFSQEMATNILRQIENGKTLTAITQEMKITLDTVYGWMKNNPEFSEHYRLARELMARSLLDELLDEVKTATPDQSLLLKTKGAILQWAIARFNPREFSDSRRIELKGEVQHTHAHELSTDQRRRIAESWMLSKTDTPVLEAVTTGPDTPIKIVEDEHREIPKRKAIVKQQTKPRKELDDDF